MAKCCLTCFQALPPKFCYLPAQKKAINSGVIDTDILQKMIAQLFDDGAFMDSYKAIYPVGGMGEAGEIAALASYLSSVEAAVVTRSGLTIDGGLVVCV